MTRSAFKSHCTCNDLRTAAGSENGRLASTAVPAWSIAGPLAPFGLKISKAFSASGHPCLINPLEVFAIVLASFLSSRKYHRNGHTGNNAGLGTWLRNRHDAFWKALRPPQRDQELDPRAAKFIPKPDSCPFIILETIDRTHYVLILECTPHATLNGLSLT